MRSGSANGRKANKHCKAAGLQSFEFNAGVAKAFSIRGIGANTELSCSSPSLSQSCRRGMPMLRELMAAIVPAAAAIRNSILTLIRGLPNAAHARGAS
jgi:hypothetical protein